MCEKRASALLLMVWMVVDRGGEVEMNFTAIDDGIDARARGSYLKFNETQAIGTLENKVMNVIALIPIPLLDLKYQVSHAQVQIDESPFRHSIHYHY